MTVNSFRVVKSFRIFENQPVCLLVIANFKAIELFTFENRMKGFHARMVQNPWVNTITLLPLKILDYVLNYFKGLFVVNKFTHLYY